MERIQVLIDRLVEQKARGASASQMLITAQMLQQELLTAQRNGQLAGSSKVSVVIAGNTGFPAQEEEKIFYSLEENEPVVLPVAPQPAEVKAEAKKEEPVISHSSYMPPFMREESAVKEGLRYEHSVSSANLPFDAMAETPTLLHHRNEKEVHEIIAFKQESLNDKLKEEKKEVGHFLKDSPIKDLRKGIGVNDKFLFVQELFRGDEAMYERSIKTINAFHILPEAEYWMNRELKVKLGWNDSKEVVQHFYQLVRRRFS